MPPQWMARKGFAMQNTHLRKTQNSEKIRRLVTLAVLVALILLFAFTPIGYLKIGVIEITFMCIPVSVGAILLGPAAGALLGALFGLTSFVQCFGTSALGAFLLSVNPVATAFVCLVPRTLCGFLTGLCYRGLAKIDRTKTVSYFLAGLCTALCNTLFFMGSLLLFFWHSPSFLAQMQQWSLPTDSIWLFLVAMVGLNGIIEAVSTCLVGGAVSKAVVLMRRR